MFPFRCSRSGPVSIQACRSWKYTPGFASTHLPKQSTFTFRTMGSNLPSKQVRGSYDALQQSFLGGSKNLFQPKIQRVASYKKPFSPSASWMLNSQIASSAFTMGTVAVLPFYALMVFAPNAEITKRSMESSIPYVFLGILYAYLLYLSWRPDTIQLMFASKYWLPELPGIAKMFSNEMTLASAWVHLLVVDLFAARQIFHDGTKNKIETRHSVSLCLLFCPVGIFVHALTKLLTERRNHTK